jgi:hypothetical protein
MRIRRLRIFLGIFTVLLIPTAASADGHRAGLGGGPSYGNGSSLWGFHLNGDYAPYENNGKYYSWVGDFSMLFNGSTLTTLMGGTSVSGAKVVGSKRFVGDGHAYVGIVNSSDNTDPALAVGGTFEFVPRESPETQWAIRLQYDRFIRGDEGKDFNRVTLGLVYRWMK